ncbi:MAG: hypothetical protein AAFY99_04805 [Pseudomonadota bacterium]
MTIKFWKRNIVAALAALALFAPLSAATGASPKLQLAQAAIVENGTYVGGDRGERFFVTIVYGEGNIRMTRNDNGNTTLFAPIRNNNFQNNDGAVIKVRNATSFVFRSANGNRTISFRKN